MMTSLQHKFKISSLKPLCVALVLLFLASIGNCMDSFGSQNSENPLWGPRDPKSLYMPFPFKVLVPAEPCGTAEVNGVRSGVCLPKGKCSKVQGTTGGTCSYGFGECCSIATNCTSDRNRVDVTEYVTTLNSPTPTDAQCTFKIRKIPGVCQVRLDFKSFTSSPADSEGNCVLDRLVISNSITVQDKFTTCGNLANQHMYLSFGSSDSIDITPAMVQSGSQYSIVATQIPCFSKRVVPSHCLQYYNTTQGVVKSFGYPNQQQNNQMYTICVETTETSQAITWRPCSATDGITTPAFSISSNPNPAAADVNGCPGDYIQINGRNRQCGETFPPSVMSPWKPFSLNVNFDNKEIPDFPAPMVTPATATDDASCSNIGTSSGGLLQCQWIMNTCQCAFLGAPPASPENLFGTIDTNNTGFCLHYQI